LINDIIPVREGDEIEVTIVSVGSKGDGISKIENGYTVIVPNSKIDDVINVKITRVLPQYAFAEIINGE